MQCLTRGEVSRSCGTAFGQMLDFASIDRFNDGLARREMAIQGADSDAGTTGDLFQTHIQTDLRKRFLGGVDQ